MLMRSAVLWPGLKPNCLLDEIKLLLRRYRCNCLCTAASIILLMLLSKEMGRYLVGSDLESLLWIGDTEAIFHWLRNTVWEKQTSKRTS